MSNETKRNPLLSKKSSWPQQIRENMLMKEGELTKTKACHKRNFTPVHCDTS